MNGVEWACRAPPRLSGTSGIESGLSVSERVQTAPNRDPDFDALEAFRAGDSDAFDLLVTRHQGRIFRLAYRILGNREGALDAAQETFVKAWKALGRFKGEARFSTWLTRIAINQCRNELRKRSTVKHTQPLSLDDRLPGTELSRGETLAGGGASAWETARGQEVRLAFTAVMRDLEPESREVLILTEVESLSYEGVAELLDVPVGTVRSRLHRARAEVRRRMAAVLGSSS